MKTTDTKVMWQEGLRLFHAARLVQLASAFHSSIQLKAGDRVADARSVLGLLMLCAMCQSSLTVVADGEDENEATRAVAAFFADQEPPQTLDPPRPNHEIVNNNKKHAKDKELDS